MIAISIQHLKKSYEDGVVILRDLSFPSESEEQIHQKYFMSFTPQSF